MSNNSHIVFIPGEVSIDIIEAVNKAVNHVRPYKYLGAARARINDIVPAAKTVLSPKIYPLNHKYSSSHSILGSTSKKAKRVKRELIDAGISWYGLLKSETRFLPKVLHPKEHIEAVVYGQHHSNSVMLVATNERIIFLDKKPMALFMDEVSYEVVSGIEFEIHTIFATLILHTPVKNYDIRFANLHCAENFARHIEAHRLKRDGEEEESEIIKASASRLYLPNGSIKHYPADNMAGYYWLPNEEEERRKIEAGLV